MIAGIDLFCGAGGLTRGLGEAGIAMLRGYDSDPRCGETYVANNPGAEFVCCDVREVAVGELRRALRGWRADALVVAACAPCQPFSKVRRARGEGAGRALLAPVLRVVRALVPDVVLMENVPGIARVRGRSAFRRFLRGLADAGYAAQWRVVDAKDYGVPQTRRRLVLIAGRGFEVPLPAPTHRATGQPSHRTVREAIAHLPPVAVGETHPVTPNHVAAALSPLNLARIRATPQDGGGRRDWGPELRLSCHDGVTGFTDVYGRMGWDRPGPTITGRCRSLSNGRFGHPTQHRAITLREAAALQSFPDDYVFHGSLSHIARQIGNAVPVALARVLGEAIVAALDRRRATAHAQRCR